MGRQTSKLRAAPRTGAACGAMKSSACGAATSPRCPVAARRHTRCGSRCRRLGRPRERGLCRRSPAPRQAGSLAGSRTPTSGRLGHCADEAAGWAFAPHWRATRVRHPTCRPGSGGVRTGRRRCWPHQRGGRACRRSCERSWRPRRRPRAPLRRAWWRQGGSARNRHGSGRSGVRPCPDRAARGPEHRWREESSGWASEHPSIGVAVKERVAPRGGSRWSASRHVRSASQTMRAGSCFRRLYTLQTREAEL